VCRDCYIEVIVWLLDPIFRQCPEYVYPGANVGLVEMIGNHLPSIIKAVSGAATKVERLEYTDEFKRSVNVLRLMGCGVAQWHIDRQVNIYTPVSLFSSCVCVC
jgi:hypothetical protein